MITTVDHCPLFTVSEIATKAGKSETAVRNALNKYGYFMIDDTKLYGARFDRLWLLCYKDRGGKVTMLRSDGNPAFTVAEMSRKVGKSARVLNEHMRYLSEYEHNGSIYTRLIWGGMGLWIQKKS
jgi:hypothetical protein